MATENRTPSDIEMEENWSEAWDEEIPESGFLSSRSFIPKNKEDNGPDVKINDDKADVPVLNSAIVINDNKAGMEGLDKDRINQIMYEASKGSSYYKNQQKREEQLDQQIQEMEGRRRKLTTHQVTLAMQKADQLIERLESSRDLSRTIVHVDMDAYYAAVEMLDRPELRDKPMAVGGSHMLSTSNYAARRFGVRAGMPGFIARKLCPNLTILPCNFAKYTAMSERFQAIFADYDPNFSAMSLDEAYMDITDHLRRRTIDCGGIDRRFAGHVDPAKVCRCCSKDSDTLDVGAVCSSCGKLLEEPTYETFGLTADEVVREMRYRIYQETCLTSSAGIAPNTMLAKVCSDMNKPNGQFRIEPTREAVMEFIKDLPIRKIGGIGKVTEKMLRALGAITCSQLYELRGTLFHLYSSITFDYFMKVCRGIGSTRVERGGQRKSMSVERTFKEHSKPSELEDICRELSQMLADDLHHEDLMGKTVTLKLKTVQFDVRTRAHTIASYTQDFDTIFAAARDILRTEIAGAAPEPLRLRLMGVRMSSLSTTSEESRQSQSTLTSLVERIKRQKGSDAKDAVVLMDTPWSPKKQSEIPTQLQVTTQSQVTTQLESAGSSGSSSNKRGLKNYGFTVGDDDIASFYSSRTSKRVPSAAVGVKDTQVNSKSNLSSFDAIYGSCSSSDANCESLGRSRTLGDLKVMTSGDLNVMSSGDLNVRTSGDLNVMTSGEPTSFARLECPVCGVTKKLWDLNEFNQHIDICLNQQTVRDILIDQKKPLTPNKSAGCSVKRRKLEPSTGTTLHKFFGSQTMGENKKAEQG